MTGQIGTIIVGVILFALATAILYIIGMKKKMNEEKRLFEMLLNNGAYRVSGMHRLCKAGKKKA